MNIFLVDYVVVFSSSAEMKTYEQETTHKGKLVGIWGSSMEDISKVLKQTLDNQSRLKEITAYQWLGKAITP